MKVSMLRKVNDPQLSLDVRQRPSFSDQLGGKAVPERLRSTPLQAEPRIYGQLAQQVLYSRI